MLKLCRKTLQGGASNIAGWADISGGFHPFLPYSIGIFQLSPLET